MTITSSGQWGTAQRCADSSGQRCLPPPGPIVGRLVRTQANFLETLPIAILALIGVVVDGRTSQLAAPGGWIWLGARVVYQPHYCAGVPKVRTLAFFASLIGLGMVIRPLLPG